MAKKPKYTSPAPQNIEPVSEEDKQLFRKAIEDISFQTIPKSDADQGRLSLTNHPTFQDCNPSVNTEISSVALSDHLYLPDVTAETTLQFGQNNLSTKQWKKLRTGKLHVDNLLDLHGLYVPQAREAIIACLQEAIQRHWRCIQIIHGRGHNSTKRYPTLKNHVNHWLREHPSVSAFHSCPPLMGGTGAVIVVIKKADAISVDRY